MSEAPRQLSEFYDQHSPWLMRRLVRRYGRQEAEDLIQDTWLRFIPYQAKTNVKRPRALLLSIATNLAVDLGRRRSRGRNHEHSQAAAGLSVEWPSQNDEMFAKDLILSLPQPLRDVFVLSRFGGLTNNQIAEQLGISPKTVEWRMTKALAHCAAQFRR